MELSPRIRRPRWTDARLLVGAVLVIVAVAATYLLVSAATSTTKVWASAHRLVPGQVLMAADLVAVEVNLAEVGERYLTAEAGLPPDSSVRRVIAEGELLPASALAPVAELSGRTVAIDIPGSVPAAIDVGGLVDVWMLPRREGLDAERPDPVQIVSAAPVAHIARDVGSFGVGEGARVEVFVPSADLTDLLAALDGDSILSVVAAPGSAER